jgi:pyridinium-3,5-biscarboxylic acid mononucleotide sulfurtransferase
VTSAAENDFAGEPSASGAAEALVARMRELSPCVIAFSGGVDSAVVAAAAARAQQAPAHPASAHTALPQQTGDRAQPNGSRPNGPSSIAVTAVSPAVPEAQRELAARVAQEIGIPHLFVTTDEITRDDYVRNDTRRCFFCKQTLYGALRQIAAQHGITAMVSGTNADDLGDYRPGIEAGRDADVATPLADLGIDKASVRRIAAYWGLSVAELPAAPCLASRIAYGVDVTPDRLRRIELAERWLGQHGFSPLRVRLHDGELARIEVAPEDLERLVRRPLIDDLRQQFSQLGFRAVTVDLAGFRSGSMNQLVNLAPPEKVTRP